MSSQQEQGATESGSGGSGALPEVGESATILSTINTDGSRRWLKPRPSPGRYHRARRAVGYFLIALFTLLPYLKINGKPAVLLDIASREFTILGTTFYPTQTLPLALLLVTVFVSIFLLTSLFGRVWCGWGCPQTVYLELVYRPLERFFEGTPGRAKKGFLQTTAIGSICKYASYVLVSCFLAHTFLAYFVGVERLAQWVQRSPVDHPTPFLVMAFVTIAMLFDFAFFREQTCLVACPYGRFQSALLDRNSLIVTYDPKRGEPRGKRPHQAATGSGAVSLPVLGDCVDCGMCVATCPTGIDIRNGLQMECVHCTQCIDACDAVMTKIGKPRGLIRYASQASIAGERRHWLRPRPVVYALVLTGLIAGLTIAIVNTSLVEVTLLQERGVTYTRAADGSIETRLRIKLTNYDSKAATYRVNLQKPETSRLEIEENPVRLEPGESKMLHLKVHSQREAFVKGKAKAEFEVVGDNESKTQARYPLSGPRHGSGPESSESSTGDSASSERSEP